MTIKLIFTEEEQRELSFERYNANTTKVRRRMEVLWLKSQGVPLSRIPELTGVSANTMRTYFRLYEKGGIDALKQFKYHRPPSPLETHIEEIRIAFEEAAPATVKEAQHRIKDITGIYRCETLIRNFIKKNSIVRTVK